MKSIRDIAEEIGVSKQAVRNEIAKQCLQSSLQKNGNQFAVDENTESLIKSAFEHRNGKLTAKVVCKEDAKVNGNQQEQVCDYQHKIELLETDNKRLLEEIELLKEQLADKKEEVSFLRCEVTEKNQIINQAQQLQALAENKLKLLETKTEEESNEAEKKKWWHFWK